MLRGHSITVITSSCSTLEYCLATRSEQLLMSFRARNLLFTKSISTVITPEKFTKFKSIKVFHNCVSIFTCLLLFVPICVNADTDASMETSKLQNEFSRNSAKFAIELFHLLHKTAPSQNIIYSPFSIQTCVGMARIGATGKTAAELDRGLGLPSSDVSTIADIFHNVLSSYVNSSILKIANKIYVMSGIAIQKDYNELVSKKFYSVAESINFDESSKAASTMNNWVEEKTNNLIKDLISPDAISEDTRLVLINAIHFKGEWEHQFPKRNTQDDSFYLNEVDSVQVPMMTVKHGFAYAELPDLDATALRMPYKNSDLSMLILLPNSRTGLGQLQEKLRSVNLADITEQLNNEQVIVKLPKFKAEFTITLNNALQELGMGRMFSSGAEFDKMLQSGEPLEVSQVVHKAFIEVNEEGTEAAAATVMRIMPVMAFRRKRFFVNRPFLFMLISNQNLIHFIGQYVN